jgi:hypothetical protein
LPANIVGTSIEFRGFLFSSQLTGNGGARRQRRQDRIEVDALVDVTALFGHDRAPQPTQRLFDLPESKMAVADVM